MSIFQSFERRKASISEDCADSVIGTKSFYKYTLSVLAISVGLVFSTTSVAANQSQNCMPLKHYTTSPNNPNSGFRNQFTPNGLLDLAQKLMHDYFEGGQSMYDNTTDLVVDG